MDLFSWFAWILPIVSFISLGWLFRENGKHSERQKSLKNDLKTQKKGVKISANNRRKYNELEGNDIANALNKLR